MSKKFLLSAVFFIFITGCSSKQKTEQVVSSNDSGNLSVVSFEVEEKYRISGLEYWNGFAENKNERRYTLTDLYKYPGDQIPDALIGEWDAIDERGAEYKFTFTANEVTMKGISDSAKSTDHTGTWTISENNATFILIEYPDNSPYSGLYYVCALQDDDHILIFRRWPSEDKSFNCANPYILERIK